jgi:HlyD family secretion protein
VVELEETTLAFELAGRIARLDVKEGAAVAAGTPVAALEDDVLRTVGQARAREAEAAEAQSALVSAHARTEDVAALEARVRAAQAEEANLARTLARQRELARQGAAPVASVDDLEAAATRARAERESLSWQLEGLRKGARVQERQGAAARASAAQASALVEAERLKKLVLTAPLAGAVLDVHVRRGEVVAAGTPVATLADPRRPYVDIFVPEGELGRFSLGAPVAVHADISSDVWRGRVETLGRRAEFTPRYLFSDKERPHLVIRVRVRVDDPREMLHAGLPVAVELGS